VAAYALRGMPTTAPDSLLPSGLPLHTRTLSIEVFAAERGRVRLEGVILDLRKLGFVPTGGELQTAGFIHHMKLRLALDPATLAIERVETEQPTVAFEPGPASGGDCCRDPAPRLQALVGAALDTGFARRLAGAFGGPLGCSHLLTLAQLIGSSAPRLLADARLEARAPDERIAKATLFLDGFEQPDGALEVAIQLSEFRLAPGTEVALPLERLAHQREVRVLARLDRALATLVHLDAAERERSVATLDAAPWRSRRARLASLDGSPALRGLAARVLAALGGDTADAALRDALLNLAPGVIQCFAALSHRLLAAFAGGAPPAAGIPRELSVGGYPDSCYMWRSGGPLAKLRAAASARRGGG
jgi:hypothetical protein